MNLADAPVGPMLTITGFSEEQLVARLSRLGLYTGLHLRRLPETIAAGAVKVRGQNGDVLLSGGLAEHVVMHLDDGPRIPLLDCRPGDEGHVEGTTGRDDIEQALRELGIVEHERVLFLRRFPAMNFSFTSDGFRGAMNESLSAHVLGTTANGPAQFSSVGAGEDFTVTRILPGDGADALLAALHVHPGAHLVLHSVAPGQVLQLDGQQTVVCMTQTGVRLYMHDEDAAGILVTVQTEA